MFGHRKLGMQTETPITFGKTQTHTFLLQRNTMKELLELSFVFTYICGSQGRMLVISLLFEDHGWLV